MSKVYEEKNVWFSGRIIMFSDDLHPVFAEGMTI